MVDVATVPHLTWNFSDNSAEEEVKTNLEIIRDNIDDAKGDFAEAITSLLSTIGSASMPSTSVDYGHVTDNIETEKPDTKPTAPDFPSTAGINKPTKQSLNEVVMPIFPDVPTFGVEAPTETFEYEEDPYSSDILTSLKNHIYQWLSNGGIELDEIVQTAIDSTRVRRRARLEDEYAKQYEIGMGKYSSMGWNLHNGAQESILDTINNEHNRRVDDMDEELTALEAKWKIENRQFLLGFAKDLEAILIDQSDKTANRLFEAAKTSVTLLYDIFKSRVQAYVAQLQGVTAEIDAKGKMADIQISINKGISEIYGIDMDGFKTEISAVVDVVDGQAKVYAAQMGGYEADIDWAKGIMAARVEKLKALIGQSTDLTGLQVKEAEVDLQVFINRLGLDVEASKSVAGFFMQVLVSSLGQLNTHVSMSDGTSRTFGSLYSHREALSNAKSLGETHTYREK